ncbi:MAG: peptide chain release factor 3 [Bacillota bacterium]
MSLGIETINEIRRRRTFAIISHPDAGKTTLTEKLLLYGGAIRLAGSVKARKAQRHAVSDWMEIEKQRGISVTSSVLQFDYNDYCINILDTPGHQDFSEDTYRTLMAADCAVMVIDSAKGVEAQTKKLFHVCKMRGIPIFTFINKMDRAGKDPFELIEEIEQVLNIRSYPMNWPIRLGNSFLGVYDRKQAQIVLFDGGAHGQSMVSSSKGDVNDGIFTDLLGTEAHEKLKEDIELLDMAGDSFNLKQVLKGELTPVFFGSAMTNFGVQNFLEEFLNITTAPLPRLSDKGEVNPEDSSFSGFVFKIQANMNPTHRDRLAFIRICSGKFTKGMGVFHMREGKEIRLTQPQQFLAQEREIVEEAYAGDIIGVFDPGIFKIGDTLIEGTERFNFEGIPVFAPEHFARVYTKNSMKRKQFIKGIMQLSEEGAIQVFQQWDSILQEYIIGVVGVLQLEVLEYRLNNEYGVDVSIEHLPFKYIRWVKTDAFNPDRFKITSDTMIAKDQDENPVLLFQNEWSIRTVMERNNGIELADILSK